MSNWHVVSCPDGDAPQLKTFEEPEAAAEYLASLEGQDVYAFVFFGERAHVSKGPLRFMILPDGEGTALPLFKIANGLVTPAVSTSTVPLDIQEDGFLGRPELQLAQEDLYLIDVTPVVRTEGEVADGDFEVVAEGASSAEETEDDDDEDAEAST